MEHESIAGDLKSCLKNIQVDTLTAAGLDVRANFVFSKEFCAYQGHFPGKPILPAIVQLASVRFLAEKVLELSLSPLNLSKVKFKGMVQPDDEITVHLNLTAEAENWQGDFTLLRDSGELLTVGHIVLGGSA
jgi:3-hydroxymyristoyl/3-hydroxydecanoyl-(acyl carrier protein) dehydratase